MMTKEEVINNIETYYDMVADNLELDLKRAIEEKIQACGIMCRVFSRKKSKESIIAKMHEKAESKYIAENKKMQDMIGIRIVLYFKDDIEICINTLKKMFEIDNYVYDELNTETFKPQKINYVYRIPEKYSGIAIDLQEKCLIDNTFEVQIRTIFSEGWHEVEHDIRYKYIDDWQNTQMLSRELNGILAVLEVCDNDIIAICESMAYRKYKAHDWEAMIRNKFRIRFQHLPLSNNLKEILDKNIKIGKAVYRFDRRELIDIFKETHLPKNCDNVIYLINERELHDQRIYDLTPDPIHNRYIKYKEEEYSSSSELSI